MDGSDVATLSPDLTGRVFGALEVVGRVKGFRKRWLCKCGCGTTVERYTGSLLEERPKSVAKSCGCRVTQRTLFTSEMDDFVRDNYSQMNIYTLSERLGVSHKTLVVQLPRIARECGFILRRRGDRLPAAPRFTDQQWLELCFSFNAGTPWSQLAQNQAVTPGWLAGHAQRFAKKHSITLRAVAHGQERLRYVCELVDQGMTYKQVADKLGGGLTRSAVAGIVDRETKRAVKLTAFGLALQKNRGDNGS